jgi:ABC-2 type transport system permease protein
MHELEAMFALTWRDLLRFARDRSQILGALARPVLWLLLMGKGLRAITPTVQDMDYQHFVFAGAIALTVLFGGMFQGITIIWDREFGFLKEVLVAPLGRPTIILGKTLAGASVTLVQGLIAVAFAPLVGVRIAAAQMLPLIGVVFLLALAVTALGLSVAARMRTFEGFGVISNFVVLPLYFLSGGVFPVRGLPIWMSALVRANPIAYGVDLIRYVIGQPTTFSPQLDVAVLGGFGAAMVLAAVALFRRA